MNATFKGENIQEFMDKTVFDCKYLGKSYSITTQLVGRFNVYNILGCIACCA
jgi:UDP-N-acetylmuramyl pentapeptide synthase